MIPHARLLAVCLGALLFAAAGSASAAQRHFVASTGVDTNPCSIAQPCRSFAAAALVVDPNGEIIVQDTAGYGFVIVTKPLSILSPYGVYAGISVFAGNDGVTINAPGGGVRLTGVYINGQGGSIGINVQNASKVTIEGSSVTNMASHGLSATSTSAHIVIRNTVFRDNGGYGVSVAGAAETTIDNVHAERNALAGFSLVGNKRDGVEQRHERQRRSPASRSARRRSRRRPSRSAITPARTMSSAASTRLSPRRRRST